jgi:molybdopterin/thiamine biosynthesis adenylyltransferase
MGGAPEPPLRLLDDRFERFRRIDWWDQARLARARVLVVGAGALGNEVLKNLGLLGVGRLVVVDMDAIERSNLCRSVLFREEDEGRPKAEVAVAALRRLHPGVAAEAVVGDVLGDVGLGWFRWAEVVVGALDNREARLFVNACCGRAGRPWIDGGIEVLNGVARGFAPPETACYECTLGQADWEDLRQRRSCSLLARRAAAGGGVPTTPTTASVIGAIQAQEVVKRLHGLESLSGSGFVFEGLGHHSYAVRYPIHPDCPWHEPPPPVEEVVEFDSRTPLVEVGRYAARRLGGLDAIDLPRELVAALVCPACGASRPVFRPVSRIREEEVACPACGAECVAEPFHSLSPDSERLGRSAAELGLPPREVLFARRGGDMLGIELAGDRAPLEGAGACPDEPSWAAADEGCGKFQGAPP